MTLVEQLRELGLTMGTVYATGQHVGWTTDEAKATAAERLGATLRLYTSSDPECTGWEVIAR